MRKKINLKPAIQALQQNVMNQNDMKWFGISRHGEVSIGTLSQLHQFDDAAFTIRIPDRLTQQDVETVLFNHVEDFKTIANSIFLHSDMTPALKPEAYSAYYAIYSTLSDLWLQKEKEESQRIEELYYRKKEK